MGLEGLHSPLSPSTPLPVPRMPAASQRTTYMLIALNSEAENFHSASLTPASRAPAYASDLGAASPSAAMRASCLARIAAREASVPSRPSFSAAC
jgi:hypothetical protein